MLCLDQADQNAPPVAQTAALALQFCNPVSRVVDPLAVGRLAELEKQQVINGLKDKEIEYLKEINGLLKKPD